MWRRLALLVAAFALVGLVAGCFHETTVAFQERFEGGLGSWRQGSDVPEDPNNPGNPVAWFIEGSADRAAEGNRSARYFLDGRQDDGTIWLARSFQVPADRSVSITLSFQLWSESESFNTLAKAAAYAGPDAPAVERDFDTAQPANRAVGWETYSYDFQVDSGPEGAVWIAYGISVVWETEVTYYVDDVNVSLTF